MAKLRLVSDKPRSQGVDLAGTETAGFSWVSDGFDEPILGDVERQPILTSPVVSSPERVGAVDQAREFHVPLLIDDPAGVSTNAVVLLERQLIREVEDCLNYGGGTLWAQLDGLTSWIKIRVEDIAFKGLASDRGMTQGTLRSLLAFTTKTYAYGQPFDVSDDFSVDRFTPGVTTGTYNLRGADWTLRTTKTVGVGGNVWPGNIAFTGGNSATEQRLIHTGTGNKWYDVTAQVRFGVATTADWTGTKHGIIIKEIDANNYLECYYEASSDKVKVDAIIAGARNNVYTMPGTAGYAATGQQIVLRVLLHGNSLTYDIEQAQTRSNFSLYDTNGITVNLAAYNNGQLLTLFCAYDGQSGQPGIVFVPTTNGTHDGNFIGDFRVWNGVNTWLPDAVNHPNVMQLGMGGFTNGVGGAVPGDVAAEMSFGYTSPSATAADYVLFAWMPRTYNWNMVWNDGAEFSTTGINAGIDGWTYLAATDITAVATGFTAIQQNYPALPAYEGRQFFRAQTAATATSGVAFKCVRRFEIGDIVNLSMRVRAVSAPASLAAVAGRTSNLAVGSTVACPTTGWSIVSVTWVCTSPQEYIWIGIRNTSAVSNTFDLDAVCAFANSTTTPYSPFYARGATGTSNPGGYRPFGPVYAHGAMRATGTGFALTADATSHAGTTYQATQAASSTVTYTLEFPILTHTVPPDDGSNEYLVDIIGKLKLGGGITSINAKVELWNDRLYDNNYSASMGAAAPWGQAGRDITFSVPNTAASNLWRAVHFGQLAIPCDPNNPTRLDVKLTLTVTTGAGAGRTVAVDFLQFAPTRRCCGSMPGVNFDANYRPFLGTNQRGEAQVQSDLTVLYDAMDQGFASNPTRLGSVPVGARPTAPVGAVDVSVLTINGGPLDRADANNVDQATTWQPRALRVSWLPRYYLAREN